MSEKDTVHISFRLNGERVTVEVAASDRLLDVLREKLALTGAKDSCSEGECGACSVLLDDLPVQSCLVPAFQVRGRAVETAEAQKSLSIQPLIRSGASQCGACSPGITVTTTWLRRHPEYLQARDLREWLAGNLCRCTGYDGILAGIRAAIEQDSGK